MAKSVTVVATGMDSKVLEVTSLDEIKSQLNLEGNFSMVVNGDAVSADYSIKDYDHVSLAKAVKGGC